MKWDELCQQVNASLETQAAVTTTSIVIMALREQSLVQ